MFDIGLLLVNARIKCGKLLCLLFANIVVSKQKGLNRRENVNT